MKIFICDNSIKVVEPTADQVSKLEDLPVVYSVHEVKGGFAVVAPKAKLFDLLYQLALVYDIEIV